MRRRRRNSDEELQRRRREAAAASVAGDPRERAKRLALEQRAGLIPATFPVDLDLGREWFEVGPFEPSYPAWRPQTWPFVLARWLDSRDVEVAIVRHLLGTDRGRPLQVSRTIVRPTLYDIRGDLTPDLFRSAGDLFLSGAIGPRSVVLGWSNALPAAPERIVWTPRRRAGGGAEPDNDPVAGWERFDYNSAAYAFQSQSEVRSPTELVLQWEEGHDFLARQFLPFPRDLAKLLDADFVRSLGFEPPLERGEEGARCPYCGRWTDDPVEHFANCADEN